MIMKTFKYSFLTLISVIISVCCVSCSEDYSSRLPELLIKDLEFDSGSSEQSMSFPDQDLRNYRISADAQWCTPRIASDENKIYVKVAARSQKELFDSMYVDRSCIVTLVDVKDNTMRYFKVFQKQKIDILINKETFEIPEEGGEVSINVQSNVEYIVEIPSSASWLTKASTRSGLSNSTIKLKADKNNSGDEREAIVKLIDPKSGTRSEFTVKQSLTPVITLSVENIEIDGVGGEIEVTVNSNFEVNIKIDDNWVNLGDKKEIGDFSFVQKFVISQIPEGGSNRNAIVSFVPKNNKWDIYKNLIISQTSFSIKESDVELLVGENYTLNVVNSSGKSLSWKSSNTSVATVNSSGKVTGVSKGNAIITVETSDGKYSDKCTITVKDITDFITAKPGGSSIMMINNLIQYGSILGWSFNNNSPQTVRLKSLQLVDGVTGNEGNIMSVDKDVAAGSSVSYNTTIGVLGIHAPVTCRFRYVYNGKEYMTTAVYDTMWSR